MMKAMWHVTTEVEGSDDSHDRRHRQVFVVVDSLVAVVDDGRRGLDDGHRHRRRRAAHVFTAIIMTTASMSWSSHTSSSL